MAAYTPPSNDLSTPSFPRRPSIEANPFALQLLRADRVIRDKAASLPWIGQPRGELEIEGDGFFLEYAEATIWTVKGSNVAFEVHGDIRAYHIAIGGGKSVVGLPFSDETPCSDNRGRFNAFQNGVIYWTVQTGAHEVYGMIFNQWNDLGRERSWLGYPVTGEQSPASNNLHISRINSFENGQIVWKPNGQTAMFSFRDIMLQHYKTLGGVKSPIGLPWDLSLPIIRNDNSAMMHFRGGHVSVPLDSPAPGAMITQKVVINFVGLECVARQETEDETSGAVSAFCPSTTYTKPVSFSDWRFKDGVRIMPTRNVIYEGPPADVLISTSLIELDTSAGNPMAVANDIVAVLNESAQVLEAAGGVINDDNFAVAAAREAPVVEDKYKQITSSKLWSFLVNLFDSPDDPYPPGYIPLKSIELKSRSFPKKLLRRPDDPNTVTYTEFVTVTAVDNGGDRGIYTFYFDVDVFDVEIPF